MKHRSRRYHRRRAAFKWAKVEMKRLGVPRKQLRVFVRLHMAETKQQ